MVAKRWKVMSEADAFDSRLESMAPSRDDPMPTVLLDGPPANTLTPVDAAQADLDVESRLGQRIETPDGPIWVEGNAVLCACPDCAAPMSLRLSLAMANCWRCEGCVELTPAQRRALQEALAESGHSSERIARPGQSPGHREPNGRPLESRHAVGARTSFAAGPRRQRVTLRERIDAIPAWLVSLLFHLLLLMILALILLPREEVDQLITITTYVNAVDEPGGEMQSVDVDHPLQDDLLPAPMLEMGSAELRQFKMLAEKDAKQLQVDDAPLATLPDVASVRRNLTTQTGRTQSLLARDPRVRADIVAREGGSTLTEAAVSRGLRWLATVQNQDGSWSLTRYERSDRPTNTGDAAGTSLALLPFLGAGQTHEFGVYKSTVAKGLAWLLEHQKANGDLRAGSEDEYGMYTHGQGSIVLIEAYAMTGDEKLREPAQKAIRFIEKAQHERGGWRYLPGQEGDTSVFGWQLMALQSARASGSGLQVNDDTLKMADYYLDLVSRRMGTREDSEISDRYRMAGVLYRYQPGREPTPPMTAEAILCRMYLGWQKNDPRLAAAIEWLTKYHLPDEEGEFNVYYWYYAAQAMHHYGGSRWKTWNQRIRNLLIASQETAGKHPGSWDPDNDVWGNRAGRIYVTSLAVCTLEVYYRHLPLFKQLDLN